MPDPTRWNDAAILRRLEAAEISLLVAQNAAISWQQGKLIANESPVAHVVASNAVEAGIAASDVICELQLGEHNTTYNHRDAIRLLRDADSAAATLLQDLVDAKGRAQYSPALMMISDARRLVNKARDLYDNARNRAINHGLPAKPQSPPLL